MHTQMLTCMLVLAALSVPVMAKMRAPLPDKLLAARTVYLENWTGDADLVDDLYEELQLWNRFKIVTDKSKADLIVRLSVSTYVRSQPQIKAESGAYVTLPVYPSRLHFSLVDPGTGDLLWTDTDGSLDKYGAKSLVKKIRKRIEEP